MILLANIYNKKCPKCNEGKLHLTSITLKHLEFLCMKCKAYTTADFKISKIRYNNRPLKNFKGD